MIRDIVTVARRGVVLSLAVAAVFWGLTGSARAQGQCGCTDVALIVDSTGSMGGAIDNVKSGLAEIIDQAESASGGDLRMSVVEFKDSVLVDQTLTTDIPAVETAVQGLFASGGSGTPEASDQAVKVVAGGTSACSSGDPGTFREECLKIAILITDALPGECNDTYVPGVTDVEAAAIADAAGAEGIRISAVLVGEPSGDEEPIMRKYADATGGAYVNIPQDGSGLSEAIEAILRNCGAARQVAPVPALSPLALGGVAVALVLGGVRRARRRNPAA